MSYTVTAPLVLAKDQEGKTHHVYQGGRIDWLSPGQAEHFLAEGLVEKVGGTVDAGNDGPPAKTATKAEWVAFAVSKGADEAEAEGLTKPELIDLYGE